MVDNVQSERLTSDDNCMVTIRTSTLSTVYAVSFVFVSRQELMGKERTSSQYVMIVIGAYGQYERTGSKRSDNCSLLFVH